MYLLEPLRHAVCAAAAVVVIAASLSHTPAAAQAPTPSAPSSSAVVAAEGNSATIDPGAVAAFERMGAYVAGQSSLAFDVTYSLDVVAQNGQTVTVDGDGHYVVTRPDKLRVELDNDLFSRTFIYDGTSFVIVSPEDNYYAKLPMRGAVREVVATLAREHAVEIPLADLFDLGTANGPANRFESAFRVGTAKVGGVEAEHFAFRTQTRDWEVWIRAGDKPVPVKFTLLDREQAAHPRFIATLAWRRPSDIPADAFAFTPAPGQKQIVMGGPAKGDDAPTSQTDPEASPKNTPPNAPTGSK